MYVPAEVKQASEALNKAHKEWLKFSENPLSSTNDKQQAKEKFNVARKELRKLKRQSIAKYEIQRDQNIHEILTDQPKNLYQSLKQSKNLENFFLI